MSLDFDAETFRIALLSIYPRLSSVSGYSLWTLTKEKTFEKLPQKVNTPGRIKAYLGSQFTGCLIIMPAEEISLVSSCFRLFLTVVLLLLPLNNIAG